MSRPSCLWHLNCYYHCYSWILVCQPAYSGSRKDLWKWTENFGGFWSSIFIGRNHFVTEQTALKLWGITLFIIIYHSMKVSYSWFNLTVLTSCRRAAATICPRPSPPRGHRSALRSRADDNVAAVTHGQHVHTPTAAAAWRLTRRWAKRPGDFNLWPFDLESGVQVMCDVGSSAPILVFLSLSVLDLGPMYATDRHQTDRQTSDSIIA